MATWATDLVRADAVHRTIFTDQAVFAAEMARIFGATWVYVAHESEVANPGDYKTTHIGLDPVIVSRDEAGRIHVLFNRCRHRAATVCQGLRGNSNVFRCPYHGWTYRPSGELTGVTHPGGYGPRLDKSRLGLGRAPRVASYRGFVFASLAADGPSLEEHLGAAGPYLDLFVAASPMGELEARSGMHRYCYEANWKFQLENSVDGYHPLFVHRSYFDLVNRRSGTKMRVYEDKSTAVTKDLGHGHSVMDQRVEMGDQYYHRVKMSPGGAALVEQLEHERGAEAARQLLNSIGGNGFNLAVFPNLVIIGVQLRVIKPVAVNRTEVQVSPTKLKGVPAALNNLRLRNYEAFFGPAGFGAPDDLEMFRRVQEGVQAEPVEWLLLSRGLERERRDEGLIVGGITDETPQRAQYREWRRLMAGVTLPETAGVEPLAAGRR